MSFSLWYLIGGVLLVTLAVADSRLRPLSVTTTMLYVVVGVILGPLTGMITLHPVRDAALLERVAELVVIVSLFAAGLKMRTPLPDRRWLLPAALAFGSMTLTVGLISLAGWIVLGLPLGGAVLLGAILAPTDPVLASDVQVMKPTDSDRLRFGLTGEAGLNDGTAFPFVMLGLGLLGLHDLGDAGWRWWVVDVIWGVGGGIAVGALLGTAVGYFVVYLRREHREAIGLDDFLALGLIAGSYGFALTVHTYGFLAVFAAGLALRRIERRNSDGEAPPDVVQVADPQNAEAIATHPETAHAFMAQAVLGFSEQLERIGTVAVVLLLGAMLVPQTFVSSTIWFVPLLLLVIRPLAVLPVISVTSVTRLTRTQKLLIAWFGIRGIGSIYYLTFAINRGIPGDLAQLLASLTLSTVAASIVVHGVTVTPLMRLYGSRGQRDRAPR